MTKIYLLKLIAAIVIGYALLFGFIWLFSKNNKRKALEKK